MLSPATRLGPYQILSALGAGGMGEVYRARDTKLNRDVAIKVLLPAVANDPDRLARFSREAQVLASLNHPNIAAIYGLEEIPADVVSGFSRTTALVMELVEGEDLSQRTARGPIPIDEALPIARQIAEALEAAHEHGIIHRDLKPANIKVRADGTVKVLDFGLAKAIDRLEGDGFSRRPADVANSPTLSIHATEAGIILGTAAYMSPEQAAGKSVDKRTDLWAFGVVLMEMLTGRQTFAGETVSHVLAAVLKDEPDWTTLPPNTPASISKLLRRCLEKDRKRRLDSAAAVRIEIDDLSNPSSSSNLSIPSNPGPRTLPWALLAAACIALIATLFTWSPWRTAPASAPRKLLASIGVDASLLTNLGASAILSPDGTTLVFAAQQAAQSRLFVRKLEQLEAAAIAGTEGAALPFFSPDGQWIGFFASGRLKKVSVTGSAVIDVCAVTDGRGGAWTDDDTIIFSPSGLPNTTLMRVPAAGGSPVIFGTLAAEASTQRWPQALPGGRGVLYTEHSSTGAFDGANLVVAPLSSGTPKVVVRGGYYGRYVPSGSDSPTRTERGGGHLIYMQQGKLFAVRFDLERLETIEQTVPALEGLASNPDRGGAQLAFSSEGTLVYVPGTAYATGKYPIDWLTREGKRSVLRATPAAWLSLQFSPDGQKLAFDVSDGKQRDIWVYEWARDTMTQLTFDASTDRIPVWTPDGRRIVFGSDRAKPGIHNLYWVNADGTGGATRLTESNELQNPGSWHPSGKFLAFTVIRSRSETDLMILPMEGDAVRGWTPGKPTVFLTTPPGDVTPMFSPDGRWIAYSSNESRESGRGDVYVRPFPGPSGQWRVSTEGGRSPQWSPTAPELLFADPYQNKIMVAPYSVVGNSFRADTPRIWSPTNYRALGGNNPYDLHPDGTRLATVAADDQGAVVQDKVVFVFNFFEYLRKIAPVRP